MMAGHFAAAIVLHKRYPSTLPFVFTFGVGFLDILFGVFAYYGYEDLTENPAAGPLGVDLHCDYTHSLLGSLLFSAMYGAVTGSPVPAFIASFSHFILDWVVHNSDLLLDPFTRIVVGGTGLWSAHPTFAYYLEAAFCVACLHLTRKDAWCVAASAYVLQMHYARRPAVNPGLGALANLSEPVKRQALLYGFIQTFGIPALIVGAILFKNYYTQRNMKK
ncbi:hypothetical protein BC940DRAFT_297033 [Gongronella butleri]|nr:hypothetical protein BC940DRAFT_297033 [Gongronella butleri]